MRVVFASLTAAFALVALLPGCFLAHGRPGADDGGSGGEVDNGGAGGGNDADGPGVAGSGDPDGASGIGGTDGADGTDGISGTNGTGKSDASESDTGIDTPLLMILLDTSGSMEYTTGCICESRTSCVNCVPSCNADPATDEKNRWAVILEAFTGTWPSGIFACEQYIRDDSSIFTHDFDYHIPYHQPWVCDPPGSGPCSNTTVQVEDGMLDAYKSKIRFGLMTFDTQPTYRDEDSLIEQDSFDHALSNGESGLWSYGDSGRQRPDGSTVGLLRFPNATQSFLMDTGVRNEEALQGALTAPLGSQDTETVNNRIRNTLLATRPFGGTPTAAALDDLYYYLEGQDGFGDKRRNRYALLVTDGKPYDDLRDLSGCDCADETECCEAWHSVTSGDAFCYPDQIQARKDIGRMPGHDNNEGGDNTAYNPSRYQCPYPTAEEAAMVLLNGNDQGRGLIRRLFVIGFSVPCDEASDSDHDAYSCETWKALDTIARAGGSGSALFADTAQELRARLEEVFREVASGVER